MKNSQTKITFILSWITKDSKTIKNSIDANNKDSKYVKCIFCYNPNNNHNDLLELD